MCLILFAYRSHPEYKLILASNRDEFLYRPTARIHRWNQAPILAGKDLQAGGTWMGVSSGSRWAALTNFREGEDLIKNAPSRGALVVNFLNSSQTAQSYSEHLQSSQKIYNGYNILLGEKEHLFYQSNRHTETIKLKEGLYGLSNHLLNTPWPKVEKGKLALAKSLEKESLNKEDLFALLRDPNLAKDEELPETGIPYEWEKKLSAMYIESPGYGTRVSTVLLQDYTGTTYIEERAYQPAGDPVLFEFNERTLIKS